MSEKKICSLNVGLRIIGKAWTMPIIEQLLVRPMRYVEIIKALDGLSGKVLRDRLDIMEEQGMVRRVPGKGSTIYYQLTDWGVETQPIIAEVRKWMKSCPDSLDLQSLR